MFTFIAKVEVPTAIFDPKIVGSSSECAVIDFSIRKTYYINVVYYMGLPYVKWSYVGPINFRIIIIKKGGNREISVDITVDLFPS